MNIPIFVLFVGAKVYSFVILSKFMNEGNEF
jgi:hypothetical protein